MTSKERIRKAVMHEAPDRLPRDFYATDSVMAALMKDLKLKNYEEIYRYFKSDVRTMDVTQAYNGSRYRKFTKDGETYEETFWGYERKHHFDGLDYNLITTRFALEDDMNINHALDKYRFPDANDFDYSMVGDFCDRYPDKAICFGHAGAYQMAATNLRNTEMLFMDMALNPEGCHRLFDGMNDFLLKHYEKVLEAGKGKIDMLWIHDDYGTQISLLFSQDMWKTYFRENLKKFVDLAHRYDCFLMQHSCGAVGPLIPHFIDCGVDILDPVQKVVSLEPEGLRQDFKGKISFHGGIDTQEVLPHGTPDQVAAECKKYIELLHDKGGYIYTGSQQIQGDVPVENILTMYRTADKY